MKNLRLLLEEGKIGEAEESITPVEYINWIKNAEEDTNSRVMYLHNLFDVIGEIERLEL